MHWCSRLPWNSPVCWNSRVNWDSYVLRSERRGWGEHAGWRESVDCCGYVDRGVRVHRRSRMHLDSRGGYSAQEAGVGPNTCRPIQMVVLIQMLALQRRLKDMTPKMPQIVSESAAERDVSWSLSLKALG